MNIIKNHLVSLVIRFYRFVPESIFLMRHLTGNDVTDVVLFMFSKVEVATSNYQ